MTDEKDINYNRCQNCGTIYNAENIQADVCSSACAERFDRCVTCGTYFLEKTGISQTICSKQCSRSYVLTTGKIDQYVLSEETV